MAKKKVQVVPKKTIGTPKLSDLIELFGDGIITTTLTRKVSKSGIILNKGKGDMLTKQVVLACGPHSLVEVGDEVEINPERFSVKFKHPKNDIGPNIKEVQVPIEWIDGKPYLFLSTREIKYKYKK